MHARLLARVALASAATAAVATLLVELIARVPASRHAVVVALTIVAARMAARWDRPGGTNPGT